MPKNVLEQKEIKKVESEKEEFVDNAELELSEEEEMDDEMEITPITTESEKEEFVDDAELELPEEEEEMDDEDDEMEITPITTKKSYANPLMPKELAEENKVTIAGKRKKKKLYNQGEVHTENGVIKINKTNSQKYHDYINLVASSQTKNILRGKLISRMETEHGEIMAVVKYGEWMVKIPAGYMIDMSLQPPAKGEQTTEQRYKIAINHRLNTMVDFICLQINESTGVAYGSHIDAMVRKARKYYSKQAATPIVKGMIVEAQVLQVNNLGVYVEAFGSECFIKNDEVSWLRQADISELYSPGDIIHVKLTDVKPHKITVPYIDPRTQKLREINTVKIDASIKQLKKNPNEEYFHAIPEQSCGVGRVTQITEAGIFVIYGDMVNVKCYHYETEDGQQPQIGDSVYMKIEKKFEDTHAFTGTIFQILKRATY